VLLKSAGPVAEAFYVYIGTPAAREIMKKYGFGLPGD
jgi:molybdate transport system substrate-binding protein